MPVKVDPISNFCPRIGGSCPRWYNNRCNAPYDEIYCVPLD